VVYTETVIVTTKLGRLEGEEQGGLAIFRNVPYAAPPVGELRFRAPEPPAPWSGVRDAREPGATAPQLLSVMRDLAPQSEDCLNLNVWTPALSAGKRRSGLPVMVFVHGGGFVSGASTHAMYDCRELAPRGDVVVVSFNYRLGALGFADLGALGETGFAADANNGLRDALAVLHWVQEHVADFGGDPAQVTLFGQSAGAMIVGALLMQPAARGLFARAIAQSGAAHHVTNRADSARIAQRFVEALGVGPRELSRLRALPAEALLKGHNACMREWVDVGDPARPLRNASMTLLPVVDGELIREPPILAAARGEGGDIPLLLGVNHDEWHFWLFLTDVSKRDMDADALLKLIDRRVPEGHAQAASELYTEELAAQLGQRPAPWQVYSAFETDRIFSLPALRLAQAREHARGAAPTFMYRFDWVGPLFEGQMGACHTMEVPFVLGSTDDGFGRVFAGGGEAARALSLRMLNAWVAFARGGAPGDEAFGEWPRYDERARATMALRSEHGLLRWPSEERVRFWSELI
jgi:para-nitrobenzyl esterase